MAHELEDVIIYHVVNYYAHDLEMSAGAVVGIKAGRPVTVATYDEIAGSERIETIAVRDEPSTAPDGQLCDQIKQADQLDAHRAAPQRLSR